MRTHYTLLLLKRAIESLQQHTLESQASPELWELTQRLELDLRQYMTRHDKRQSPTAEERNIINRHRDAVDRALKILEVLP